MNPPASIAFEDELNPQQLQVVTSDNGPMLVIAGAGSGKTRTLTYRVAYLVESGVEPHRILLLTFTNKASREMTSRVESILPCDIRKIWGGTFHHIANRILRVHAGRLGLSPNYTILDQSDAVDILDSCLEELGHKKKDGVIPQGSALYRILSLACNTRTGLEDLLDRRFPFFLDYAPEIATIGNRYREKKQNLNLLDFDDLLSMLLTLLEQDSALRDFYAQRFEHILVDEYQDTNKLQADIIDSLASCHRNLMVVGDDSQSIYSFRGANFANIMNFRERYPDARMYKLEYNYRSSPEILGLANEIITGNKNQYKKILQPVKTSGVHPCIVTPSNVHEQARFVADTVNGYICNGMPPGEIAVLYRAHFHSMELQMELTRRAVQFEVRSGIRFFEQAHIKDITAYLKVLVNPRDEAAWKRILQLLPGIGKKTAQKVFSLLAASPDPLGACLGAAAEARIPKAARTYWPGVHEIIGMLRDRGPEAAPAAIIKAVLEHSYRDYMRSRYTDAGARSDDIEQFIEFAWQYDTLTDFLSELALLTSNVPDEIGSDMPRETIKLSTIHQAKGLEWSVVFIIWLVEGRFPNAGNFDSLEDEEEERRLFYVAATRAKDALYLCAPCCHRDNNGYTAAMKPSRFLRELPEGSYEYRNTLYGTTPDY